MLWFLVGVGLLVTALAVRDLLHGPDPATEPDPRQAVPRGGDHTDWSRAWNGGGPGVGSSGTSGGSAH